MGLEPLVVTAHTPAGFCAADPWSPSLDAILAYWTLRARLGEEAFALNQASGDLVLLEPADLPLAVERWGEEWWWQVSSPRYDARQRQQMWHHRRFNAQEAERYTDARSVQVKAGPYKNARVLRTVQVAASVSWHCIGDAAALERLLRRCVAIGAGRGAGRGDVTGWDVELGGDRDAARFARPLPMDFAAAQGIMGVEMRWGIRPPGWLAQHKRLCVLP